MRKIPRPKPLDVIEGITSEEVQALVPVPAKPFPPKGKVLEPNGRGLVPSRKDTEYEAYLADLAPVDELRVALAQAGGDKALGFLSDLIRHSRPMKNAPSISALAKRNGLSMDQMAEIWRNYSLAKGITKLASVAPTVAVDMIESAKSSQVACPRCGGDGTLDQMPERLGPECPTCFGAKRITKIVQTALGSEQPIDMDCPKCNTPVRVVCKQCKGVGLIRKAGDADSLKIYAESVGWTKAKGPGLQVNINAGHSVESVLDEIDRHMPYVNVGRK